MKAEIEERTTTVLNDLLQLFVPHATELLASLTWGWVLRCQLSDIDVFGYSYSLPPDASVAPYNVAVEHDRRRSFLLNCYEDQMRLANFESQIPRVTTGGRETLGAKEFENRYEEIVQFLVSLPVQIAFETLLSITVNWAKRCDYRLAVDFAMEAGNKTPDQWTDAALSQYLVWRIFVRLHDHDVEDR